MLYSSHIIALGLFCCHCRRRSYPSGIRLLQLCRVIQRSVNKADHCRCLLQWPGKNSNLRSKPSVKFWLLTPTRNQKMFSDSRVAITNTGQRNHPSNCTIVCVLLTARKRALYTYKCTRCDVGLCVVPCLAEYHTKVNL